MSLRNLTTLFCPTLLLGFRSLLVVSRCRSSAIAIRLHFLYPMPNGSELLVLLSTRFLRTAATLRHARYVRQRLGAGSSPAASTGKLLPSLFHSKFGFSISSVNLFHTQAIENDGYGDAVTSISASKDSLPWPEWSKLANLLLDRSSDPHKITDEDDDSFVEDLELSGEFLKAVEAFLGFARDRPDILRLLSKKNVESVVLNGSPFLFKNGEKSASRMKLFLGGDGSTELGPEKAQTIDIMRYLLSYGHSRLSSSGGREFETNEPLEASVRKLLVELFNLSGTVWKPKSADSSQTDPHIGHQQSSMLPGQAMNMKTGDWFCLKCNTVNFARNMYCFECREARPTRQVTIAEWKCLQCGFFNYERNASCLRCDSKRPGDTKNPSTTSDLRVNITSSSEQILGRLNTSCSKNDHKQLTTVDFKFSECPSTSLHLGGSTNSTQLPTDNVNVHGRYTANSMHQSTNSWSNNNAYNGKPTSDPCQPPNNSWNNYDISYIANDKYSTPSLITLSNNSWSSYGGSTPNSPQPPFFLGNKNNELYGGSTSNLMQTSSHSSGNGDTSVGSTGSSAASNAWDGCGAYGGYITNSTQPAYSYNHSPVSSSYPPGQYLNGNNSQHGGCGNSWGNGSSSQPPYNLWNNYNTSNDGYGSNSIQSFGDSSKTYNSPNTQNIPSGGGYKARSIANNSSPPPNLHNYCSNPYDGSGGNSTQPFSSSVNSNGGVLPQTNSATVKSLEGSCVKEVDPLDMSEEAKAERWFRRVAQIKDISELSQIPDEDFPQIMPMRKGVNRFVVSKRKTPLERRLASQQYKRNLPAVGSDPENHNDN
ncbi:Zinc finger protein VAR3, chloroplastic [Apostasia shenzhenica]|uniref:Zinc finger protein VAR3, chloroplastic n=1 Tax=Apostasia shenzhenica TaxID=1088818 RepID=A0A2I0A8C6_9ASPA|nr:Zinc finger protein VAR3, chloroplastic [Apostasia shenzhenica]